MCGGSGSGGCVAGTGAGMKKVQRLNRALHLTFFHKTFSLTFIMGFSIWVLSPIAFNQREPWDASPPTYLITLLLAGFLSALIWGRQLLASYFGIWIGQFLGLTVVTFLQPSTSEARAWWGIVPVITTGMASVIVFGGIVIGLFVKFMMRHITKP